MTTDKQERIELLNRVMNSPDVLPFIAPGYLVVEAGTFFDKPGNHIFGDDRGLIMFCKVEETVYDMHYLLGGSMSGAEKLRRTREAITDLFTKREVSAITGATPRDNLRARVVNRLLGGVPYGETVDSLGQDCIIYRLERAKWLR